MMALERLITTVGEMGAVFTRMDAAAMEFMQRGRPRAGPAADPRS